MKSYGHTTAGGPLSDTGIPLPTATRSGRDIVSDIERSRRTPVVVLAPIPQVSTPSPRVQAVLDGYAGGKSLREVAAQSGVAATTIRRWLTGWGVPVREPVKREPSQRKPGTPGVPLSPERVARLIEVYVAGATGTQAAKEAGCSLRAGMDYLRKAGVVRPNAGNPGYRAPDVAGIIADYAAGQSTEQIAKARRHSKETVRKLLRDNGVTLRPGGGSPHGGRKPRNPFTDEQVAELYVSGMSTTQIAAQLGISGSATCMSLRRSGTPVRNDRGGRPKKEMSA